MLKLVTFALGLAAPALLLAQGTAAGSKGPSRERAGARATAPTKAAADSDAVVRARLLEEERHVLARLMTLRSRYLARADWAELGDRCNPGALRVFPRDTSQAARDSLQALVEAMEDIVVGRGAGASLATPDARRLLRTIVGWEAGVDRPNWDVPTGQKPRLTIATGLTGDVPDPQGPGCLPSAVAQDTVTFVIPGVTDMEFPKAPKPRVKAYFGPQGQQHARDEFFTAVGSKNPEAALLYVMVAPMVIWKDWAAVAVRRPEEKGGVQVNGSNRGGATYLMRRVGAEWRVLAIVRTWGSV